MEPRAEADLLRGPRNDEFERGIMMSPNFRTVLRGYEPTQVDAELGTLQQALDAARAELGELAVQLKQSRQGQLEAETRLAEANARAEEATRAAGMAARPTFEDLGRRVGQILSLAEEEAAELRQAAQADAARLGDETNRWAQSVADEADRYAEETRASAEAEADARLAGAQRRADELIEHAEREAAARREEAEVVYETQQARAAQAATDFERTLAERRDAAAADFALVMGQRDDQLRASEEDLRAAENEARRVISDAGSQAEALRARAARDAEEIIAEARTKAERIRRDSERELAAVTQRRDSITAQLSNVRQMLATLGGGAVLAATDPMVVDGDTAEVEVDVEADADEVDADEAMEVAEEELEG